MWKRGISNHRRGLDGITGEGIKESIKAHLSIRNTDEFFHKNLDEIEKYVSSNPSGNEKDDGNLASDSK